MVHYFVAIGQIRKRCKFEGFLFIGLQIAFVKMFAKSLNLNSIKIILEIVNNQLEPQDLQPPINIFRKAHKNTNDHRMTSSISVSIAPAIIVQEWSQFLSNSIWNHLSLYGIDMTIYYQPIYEIYCRKTCRLPSIPFAVQPLVIAQQSTSTFSVLVQWLIALTLHNNKFYLIEILYLNWSIADNVINKFSVPSRYDAYLMRGAWENVFTRLPVTSFYCGFQVL